MYECPSCGSSLHFDIPSQKLLCDHCNTSLDPYQYQKDHDVEENTMYDVTVFTCPQCGGEILSAETSVASFCSFCGASAILDSHIRNEKRPGFIIPFKKTKKDCRDAYQHMMRHALFAPKELKDPEYIDHFRGIYIPYWVYIVSQKGNVSLDGTQCYRSGDYMITDHYNLNCNLDASYKGISYDASSSFDDHISETIAPFDSHDMQPFTPSILCGFYADTADVNSDLYTSDAKDFADTETSKQLTGCSAFSGYQIKMPDPELQLDSVLGTDCERTDSAMFPIWFLTYRKKDRVAYAIVNGQTGKVSADLPVDEKKYIAGSLLLALPVFLLLNLFLSLKASSVLILGALLALVTSIIYLLNLESIRHRETHDDDRGYTSTQPDSAGQSAPSRKQTKKWNTGAWKSSFQTGKLVTYIIIGIFLFQFLFSGILNAARLLSHFSGISFFLLAIAAGFGIRGWMLTRKLPGRHILPELSGSLLAVLVSCLITVMHPVSDIYYYGGTILAFAGICFTLLGIMKKYNILSTRPLPQFNRQGGNDRA